MNEQEQPRSGSAKMRPRARIINLLGDELISDEPVAIVELVKNSYDADAAEVKVVFEGELQGRPQRIVVTDDGHGMNLDTVLNSWFEPGTIAKRTTNQSPGGRPLLGAKGIGRFAAARLAERLTMETKCAGSDEAIKVTLDWGDFGAEESESKYLDEVKVEWEYVPAEPSFNGTVLVLDGLCKKEWKEKDFEELHARLTRLVSPFREVADFKILLDIPGYPQFSGEAEPPQLILDPKYLLRGTLDESGKFNGSIEYNGKERKSFKDQQVGKTGKTPLCGAFKLEVRAWDRDTEGLEPYSEKLSLSITEIRRTLDNFCGVSIYRDGFRIHPYGQTGNDWLKLDNRSRQNPVRNLANNQLIAAIKISREDNPELKDRSTREGMVLNDAHSSLEDWFRRVLSLLEEERYRIRPRRKDEDRIEPLFEAFDISEATKAVRRELGRNHPTTLLVADTQRQVREGIERVQNVFSRLLMSSGRGQMIDIVIHEIGAPLGKTNREIAIIEKRMTQRCESQVREQFSVGITSIKAWMEQIHNLRERLDPQTPAKRGRATTFEVEEEIEDNFELYQSLLEKQRITYKLLRPKKPVRVKMSRASLGHILANLLDNSIYWLVDQNGPGKGGTIRVKLETLDQGFRILFCDDGPGVSPEDQARIFEPYYSTKRGGSGMGLGLYICRLVIEPYGKILYRDDHGNLSGACFEVRFERRVGK